MLMLKKHGQNHFQFLPGEIFLNTGVLTPSEGQICSTFYLSFRKVLYKTLCLLPPQHHRARYLVLLFCLAEASKLT